MNWETLLCFGDSITIGSRSYLSYPEYAGEILRQKTHFEWNTFNFAKSGITSVELHRMIAVDFGHLKELSPELITILIGTNDAKKSTPVANFELAFRQVLLKAKLIAPNALLIVFSIPRLRKGVKLPYTMAMNETIDEYNKVIKKISGVFEASIIEPQLMDTDFCDGIHLNETGCRKLGEQITDYVLKLRGMDIKA
jgi:lysophospholipase L1-like esterase